MNFDLGTFYTLAILASIAACKWWGRRSESAARREWAAYYRWIKGGKN